MALELIHVPRVQDDHGRVGEHHLKDSPTLTQCQLLAPIEQDTFSYLTEALRKEVFRGRHEALFGFAV
jgi:hypothetical protein